jgi:uncharacterized membrane protein
MKRRAVKELIMIGFSEKMRAVEVLPQLQRLRFDWSADLHSAVAVEVEEGGKLRLHHSHLLDPASGMDDAIQWKAILNAIVPLPHIPPESAAEVMSEVRRINAEGTSWLKGVALDRDFIRNAAALLGPDNSAILAIIRNSESAIPVLLGYSHVVLRTTLFDVCGGFEATT